MPSVTCKHCLKIEEVPPSRSTRYVFCSYACRGVWRRENSSGPKNPIHFGKITEKACELCQTVFTFKIGIPYKTFMKQRFCSMRCAGLRTANSNHLSKKVLRREGHAKWAKAVITRDNAICQKCGAHGVELQAHHIKDFLHHPELRKDVENGVTLCAPCHWNVHAKPEENGVNCWKIPPEKNGSEDNQQPSIGRKPFEGSTTSRRSYRRIDTNCAECGKFLSKRASDVLGKKQVYCDRACAGKARSKNMIGNQRAARK